jgi:hypothetical protein
MANEHAEFLRSLGGPLWMVDRMNTVASEIERLEAENAQLIGRINDDGSLETFDDIMVILGDAMHALDKIGMVERQAAIAAELLEELRKVEPLLTAAADAFYRLAQIEQYHGSKRKANTLLELAKECRTAITDSKGE